MNQALRVAVIGICAVLFLAPVFAPYDENEQHRDEANQPPANVHLRSASGGLTWPYVVAESRQFPIRFYARFAHIPGVAEPGRIFIFGTDEYGRDLFSRSLYAGRRSLAIGAFAALVAVMVGFAFGALAGFAGGAVDAAVMRGSELFLSLPLVYLLLGFRALLPLHIGEWGSAMLVVVVAVVAGWPRPARMVRGVFMSAKERPYVSVARSLGATNLHIVARHLFPHVRGLLWTQAAALVPPFMLVDVTLSFLGLGGGEPNASWGGMLGAFRHFWVIESHLGYVLAAGSIGFTLFLFQFAVDQQAKTRRTLQ